MPEHTDDKPTGFEDEAQELDSTTSPTSSIRSRDLDDAYLHYKHAGDHTDFDAVEARKVLRKIDLRLVPVLFVVYLLQYLDKNGINYASVYGLQKGTHLVGDDYSWLGSIFYFGVRGVPHRMLTVS